MNVAVPDILKKIVETKKEELKAYTTSLDEFKRKCLDSAPALSFYDALAGQELAVIAEVKKASPSAGIIADTFEPRKIAEAYQKGRADTISVLTDVQYFKGSADYIPMIRDLVQVPILRKDFIIDPIQIYEARALGADTFLLIAAILSVEEMIEFIQLGRSMGMEPLVEVHDEAELNKALQVDPRVLGVNNRNLHTFDVSLETSFQLKKLLPEDCLTVSESGIFEPAQAARLAEVGFDALLIGQSLMEAGLEHCGEKIAAFKKGIS